MPIDPLLVELSAEDFRAICIAQIECYLLREANKALAGGDRPDDAILLMLKWVLMSIEKVVSKSVASAVGDSNSMLALAPNLDTSATSRASDAGTAEDRKMLGLVSATVNTMPANAAGSNKATAVQGAGAGNEAGLAPTTWQERHAHLSAGLSPVALSPSRVRMMWQEKDSDSIATRGTLAVGATTYEENPATSSSLIYDHTHPATFSMRRRRSLGSRDSESLSSDSEIDEMPAATNQLLAATTLPLKQEPRRRAQGGAGRTGVLQLGRQDDKYVVTCAMPGVKRDDLALELEGNHILILKQFRPRPMMLDGQGHEADTDGGDHAGCLPGFEHSGTRAIAQNEVVLEQALPLPHLVDADSISTSYRDGLLKIILSRTQLPAFVEESQTDRVVESMVSESARRVADGEKQLRDLRRKKRQLREQIVLDRRLHQQALAALRSSRVPLRSQRLPLL